MTIMVQSPAIGLVPLFRLRNKNKDCNSTLGGKDAVIHDGLYPGFGRNDDHSVM